MFCIQYFLAKNDFFGLVLLKMLKMTVNIGSFEQLGPELLQLNNEQTSCPLVLYFRLCVENCR